MDDEFDIVIKNGMVIDGSGTKGKRLDIGIKGDVIKLLGNIKTSNKSNVINAEDMIVAPGFVDIHSHSDFLWLLHPECNSKVYDGVTTEICGNCGSTPFPIRGPLLDHRRKGFEKYGLDINWNTTKEYFDLAEKTPSSINRGFLVGHGNLRACNVGYGERKANSDELDCMKKELTDALNLGVFGMSSGIAYPPGCFATNEELVELCKVVKNFNGIYTTHIRDEGDFIEESLSETIQVAQKADVNLQISHIKTAGKTNWLKLENIETILNQARSEGIKLNCDRYPYIASSTDLDAIFPKWVYEGGIPKEIERLKNKKDCERLKRELIEKGYDNEEFWRSVVVSMVLHSKNRDTEGKNIWNIAMEKGKPPFDTVRDLLIEEEAKIDVLFFNMSESNLEQILKWDFVMIGSDSSVRSINGLLSEGLPHPRSYGTFSRVLGRFCRDKKILNLNEAIYKMSGLPATKIGLKNRGFIREGYFADIVIFDRNKIDDMSEFVKPHQYSVGINYVIVNGKITIEKHKHTGVMGGTILRHN